MNWLLAVVLLVPIGCSAAAPKPSQIASCLLGHAATGEDVVQDLPGNEVLRTDDYIDGFDAPYYVRTNGMESGYAAKGKQFGILYDGRVYPAQRAKKLLGGSERAPDFDPALAYWGKVGSRKSQFLCVSFNLGALGYSGSFQKVRGAYLLSLPENGRQRTLYFVVADPGRIIVR